MDIKQVITFTSEFINMCTQHDIVLLTGRLKIESNMINVRREYYEEICKLLRSQRIIVHTDSLPNSILKFSNMEHKAVIMPT